MPTLFFPNEVQEEIRWCWAAIATGVAQHFSNASPWSQCLVAIQTLGNNDCCGDGADTTCNVPASLADSLTVTGNLRDNPLNRPLLWTELMGEIDNNNPVGCFIRWSNGQGGHVVAIHGYSPAAENGGVDLLEVWDPLPQYGQSIIPFSTLVHSYRGIGQWTRSYLTQP